jgi:hypothetical protein
MSSAEAPVVWLWAAILARKAAAEAASGKEWATPTTWTVITRDGNDEHLVRWVAHTEDCGYDPRPDAANMVLNDPRDTVARCEAELAILDEAEKAFRVARTYKDGDGVLALACARTWLDAVRLLAGGYKHREGYREEDWKP